MSAIASTVRRPPSLLKRVSRNTSFVLGGSVFALIVLMALFAPLLTPHDPYLQNLGNRMLDPIWLPNGSWEHPLGTDSLGRDYLSRLLYGARISLLIGVLTVITSGIIGTTLGLCAGYFGGRVDLAINFIIVTRLTLPLLMVALAVVALVGSSLPVLVMVMGFLMWDRFAVVMRAAAQQLRNQEYIQAAQSQGFSAPRILLREVMPNIFDRLAVIATFEMANAILVEATLSFLGLGVQPPTASWGLMISEGRQSLLFDSWMIMIPGIALCVLVLAINMIGDGLRDALSPSSRN